MKGQQIITCKKCGSNKVNRQHPAIAAFLGIGCAMWIPIIGWILIPIFFIIGLVTMFGKVVFKCEECKHVFPVTKDQLQEYKQALK